MNTDLSIGLSVHFSASPSAAGFVCYTAAILLAATSQPIVYWLEEVVGPVAQRFGEWRSASRNFSANADLLAVVHREVARLLVLIL